MTSKSFQLEFEREGTLVQWLFNPFMFVAGWRALVLGLGVVVLSALVGSLSNTHFDGVLDLHIKQSAPLWFFVAEGMVDWLALVVVLLLLGKLMSQSSFRVIDVFGTQALARWPGLISALVMLPDANRKVAEYIMARQGRLDTAPVISCVDVSIFAVALVVVIAAIIWMVVLMYNAYSISCNLKGKKAILSFIAALVVAEVISKFAILGIFVG